MCFLAGTILDDNIIEFKENKYIDIIVYKYLYCDIQDTKTNDLYLSLFYNLIKQIDFHKFLMKYFNDPLTS